MGQIIKAGWFSVFKSLRTVPSPPSFLPPHDAASQAKRVCWQGLTKTRSERDPECLWSQFRGVSWWWDKQWDEITVFCISLISGAVSSHHVRLSLSTNTINSFSQHLGKILNNLHETSKYSLQSFASSIFNFPLPGWSGTQGTEAKISQQLSHLHDVTCGGWCLSWFVTWLFCRTTPPAPSHYTGTAFDPSWDIAASSGKCQERHFKE